MKRIILLIIPILALTSIPLTSQAEEVAQPTLITPLVEALNRQSRSYYGYRYGRPAYERQSYDRPRCGRCYDDDDDDDSEEVRHRPRSKTRSRYDSDEDDRNNDNRRTDDRNSNNNGTEEEHGEKKKDRHGGRRRDKDRHRNDDRDRYRPDYYDRFLRDPYRERDYDRPYYDDYYRDRRYQEEYPSRYYDGYSGYRRPYDRYDDAYGGYGPSDGRGPHGRPWDETYRGQAGWDAGGRGYYFASGRPDSAPAQAWGRPEYARPQTDSWQGTGYSGYRDPLEYRGSVGYSPSTGGYRQDLNYGQSSGWRSVGRPYRDESAVKKLEAKNYQDNRPSSTFQPTYRSNDVYNQNSAYGQSGSYGQNYGQQDANGQSGSYGQQDPYGQTNSGQNPYGRGFQSTTQETSYLFQREDSLPIKVNDTNTNTTETNP